MPVVVILVGGQHLPGVGLAHFAAISRRYQDSSVPGAIGKTSRQR
ncbi:hypothetical protein ABZS88_35375 [Streptomyces sp. NPDC005480]